MTIVNVNKNRLSKKKNRAPLMKRVGKREFSEEEKNSLNKICFELATAVDNDSEPVSIPTQVWTNVLNSLLRRHPHPQTKGLWPKSLVLDFYQNNWYPQAVKNKKISSKTDKLIRRILQLKPIRTSSGVATITTLTKPYPCPGQCLFCPADVRMPKSYLPSEPGAQRAEQNYFDPYLQTTSRLLDLYQMGHPLDKIELIILGGTWTAYPECYQRWYIAQSLRALNDFSAEAGALRKISQKRAERIKFYQEYQAKIAAATKKNGGQGKFLSNNQKQNELDFAEDQSELENAPENYNCLISQLFVQPERQFGMRQFQAADWDQVLAEQSINQTTTSHNVGLVIETRPDEINPETLMNLRRLGCTKIQIGVQSVNDDLLAANRRGLTTQEIANAFELLRLYGFKIHAHFMANLYQSEPEIDKVDFAKFVNDPRYQPDELKLYPCALLKSAALYDIYQRGDWMPYTEAELLDLLVANVLATPVYCRLTRMIRDISSDDIVVGNKKTNFRQLVDTEIKRRSKRAREIRAREIRGAKLDPTKLTLRETVYETTVSSEHFLEWVTTDEEEKIAGFLRLSLPKKEKQLMIAERFYPAELLDAAIIREVHVYGVAAKVNQEATGNAQHLGLGKKLIAQAEKITRERGYKKMAVISAIGTREYYRKRGFEDGELYQVKNL